MRPHDELAASAAGSPRHSLPAQPEHGTRLRAAVNADALGTVDRLDRHLSPEPRALRAGVGRLDGADPLPPCMLAPAGAAALAALLGVRAGFGPLTAAAFAGLVALEMQRALGAAHDLLERDLEADLDALA